MWGKVGASGSHRRQGPHTRASRTPVPSAAGDLRLFQGKFEHTIDEKGRLAVPLPFRRKISPEDNLEAAVMVTISDQCLAAYPLVEWAEKLAMIAKLNQLDPKVMAFKRIFIGCAQECPIDKAGRILIPLDLRKDARLVRDCTIVGQLEKFELWATERWQASFPQLTDQVGAIYASLAELGIQI